MSGHSNRYLCLSTDAQGYGQRSDRDQSALQEDLVRLLDEAAETAGLRRSGWLRQPSGDGELALLPPDEAEAPVLDGFVRAAGALLFWRNQDRRPGDRLRLRLAADHGPVDMAANGFAGRPVVAVSRLVNSRVLKLALATAHADLVVIVSDRIYTDLVLGGRTSVTPAEFRMVPVREKEFAENAWLRVPGVDVHGLDLGIDEQSVADPPAARDRSGQIVVNRITGRVDASGAVIGIRNG
jgi:hypothetical protein